MRKMMGDKIHPTHFQVPEMPWKEKEKQAILLLQSIIDDYNKEPVDETFLADLALVLYENTDLVDWVMKYKGE